MPARIAGQAERDWQPSRKVTWGAECSALELTLRQQGPQLSECPRQMFADRPCRASKLEHDPAIELRFLEVAADGVPVEGAVARREVVVEAAVMIVRVDV